MGRQRRGPGRLDQLEHAGHDVAGVVEQRLVGVQRQVGQHHEPAVAGIGGEATRQRGGERRPAHAAGAGHRHQPPAVAGPAARSGGGGVAAVSSSPRPRGRATVRSASSRSSGPNPTGSTAWTPRSCQGRAAAPVVGRHDRASLPRRQVDQVAVERPEAGIDHERRERPARTAAAPWPPRGTRPSRSRPGWWPTWPSGPPPRTRRPGPRPARARRSARSRSASPAGSVEAPDVRPAPVPGAGSGPAPRSELDARGGAWVVRTSVT